MHGTALLIESAPHRLAVQGEDQALLVDTALADLLEQPGAYDLIETGCVHARQCTTKRVGVRRDEPLVPRVVLRAERFEDRLGTVRGELNRSQ